MKKRVAIKVLGGNAGMNYRRDTINKALIVFTKIKYKQAKMNKRKGFMNWYKLVLQSYTYPRYNTKEKA